MALQLIPYGPPVVLVELFCNWMDLTDLCRLDSAMTNNYLRPLYEHYFTAYRYCVFKSDVTMSDDTKFLKWVIARQVYVNKLRLTSPDFKSDDLVPVYPLSNKISILHLENCTNVSEDALKKLLKCSPHLVDLRLWNCNISDDVFSVFDSSNGGTERSFSSLAIGCCSKVTEKAITLLGGCLRSLSHLTLSDMDLSVEIIVGVLESCHSTLESFHCDRCFEVGGMLTMLKQLASEKHLPLKRFNVRHKFTVNFDTTVHHAQQWILYILSLELRGSVVLHIGDEVNTIQTNMVFKSW